MSEADYHNESGDMMSANSHDDALSATEPDVEKAKPKPKQKRKTQPLKYPEGYERLTKKGKGTWAKGCGPLPDDIDWSTIDYNVLKDQCSMRGIPQSGKRAELVQYLTDYKEPDFSAMSSRPTIVGMHKSATGERRRSAWQDEPPAVHVKNAVRIKNERMYILAWSDVSTGSMHAASFTVATEGTGDRDPYCVKIDQVPSCDCPATKYHRQGVCKHILYILAHVLKITEPLLIQESFFTEDLAVMLEPVLGPPSNKLKMAVNRKELAGEDCPICFKDFGDGATTTRCLDCSAAYHTRCFNQYTELRSGYSKHAVACILCQQPWTLPGPWGQEALNIEDQAIADAKVAEKAAAKEAKAAAKAAEKAATKKAKEAAKAEKKTNSKKSKK
ncbi:hypothetical protein Micbo1qcDRAFT_217586 [Microdochium bolleyi]|uniref:Postreplication repair E3 ubiquitin-protein ligase RAD18 n=1 Tax=Microdochium bolleyi TaxID=196109 RepID=A0A136JFG5_9PEZI|nr:hypothetical protein Micbo1qcDRAFT_217586 [Microdochium bolleyi]